jgi:hypothetical protein
MGSYPRQSILILLLDWIRDYVQSCFQNCTPEKRNVVEEALIEKIKTAFEAGALQSADWNEMPLPKYVDCPCSDYCPYNTNFYLTLVVAI